MVFFFFLVLTPSCRCHCPAEGRALLIAGPCNFVCKKVESYECLSCEDSECCSSEFIIAVLVLLYSETRTTKRVVDDSQLIERGTSCPFHTNLQADYLPNSKHVEKRAGWSELCNKGCPRGNK